MYQVYQITGLLLDLIKHAKDMLVLSTQKRKKSMAAENGHVGRVKSSKSTPIVLGYGKGSYDIANSLQDSRKRTNIGIYSAYKSTDFKEKQPFRVDFRDKPKERVAEVTKMKNTFQNCGSTDHYANKCQKAKKKVYAIEQVPEEEFPTEDSESDSMGNYIREQSDNDQDPREEFLLDYQGKSQLEIQDIQ
ncbi:hypothetical protein O181_007501 [Austropuccinia psidii MF-1]|uniref:Uncharacterized protein n=1 Tax=Austropuccinia psidii MF-1 TaxID=1389203 RepID=A0A9Q3GHN4_9BASI|nr:hypothetical protein [Austropuccinia psidii MF-1]